MLVRSTFIPSISSSTYSPALGSKIRQAGTTMIEVLIALVVLAIGLLGVLGLQAEGSLANQRGLFSTQAAFLAQDMAERIRAYDDPQDAADDNDFDGTDTDGSYSAGGCLGSACTKVSLLGHDRGEWKEAIEDSLPQGKGLVEWDGANSVYTITLIWEERSSLDVNDDCGNDVPTGFTCFAMEVQP